MTLAATIDFANLRHKAVVSIEKTREQVADRRERAKADLTAAEHRLAEASDAKSRWQAQWTDAVKVLDGDANLSATAARAILETIDQLVSDIDQTAELTRHWSNQNDQIKAYEEAVAKLVDAMEYEPTGDSASRTVADLHDQLGRAREQKATRDGLVAENDRIRKQIATAKQSIASESARLKDLCREAGCESVGELINVERRANRRMTIQQEIDSLEKLLRQWTKGAELNDFIADAESEDPDRLAPRIDQLAEQLAQSREDLKALSESIGDQKKALENIDGSAEAAEAAEDAQVAPARVREHAETYSRVKMASVVLKRAVQRYREQNQGPVLERASELFAELTLGGFVGLRSDFGDDGEPVLVGLRKPLLDAGSLVTVDGMSEGTCDQLFLALRIASLELHFQSRPPIPFVVDDILLKFDDRRAAAAMKVLAELSKKTQVIMFTHHEHLLDVARDCVPTDTLFIQRLESHAGGDIRRPQKRASKADVKTFPKSKPTSTSVSNAEPSSGELF